jgi:hypothetical protein
MQRGGGGGGAGGRDFGGMGPQNYQRSPDLIGDEVVLVLTADPDVDATDITVLVGDDGIVTLIGAVDDRDQGRRAEDLASGVPGVTDVRNQLDTGTGGDTGAGRGGGGRAFAGTGTGAGTGAGRAGAGGGYGGR